MSWLKKKQEEKKDTELWDKTLKILQLIEVEQAKINTRLDGLETEIKGIKIKYGRLLRSLEEDDDIKDTNSQSGDYLNRNILGM